MDGHGLGCSGAARPHMVDFKAGKHREGTRRRTPPCLCARLLLFTLHDGFDRKTSFKARGVHSNSRVKVPKLPFSASYSNKRAVKRVSARTNEALRRVFSSDPAAADRQEAEVGEGWAPRTDKRCGRVVIHTGRSGQHPDPRRTNVAAQASRCTLQSHSASQHGSSRTSSRVFWINPTTKHFKVCLAVRRRKVITHAGR